MATKKPTTDQPDQLALDLATHRDETGFEYTADLIELTEQEN